MKIGEIAKHLEGLAPLYLQEEYDNAGLLTGDLSWNCTGVICCLDSTEDVVREAMKKNCNLIVAHHPIIFSGIKKLTIDDYIQKTVIAAIKNDIAIYSIHTNLDNVINGVNGRIADKLEVINREIIQPPDRTLSKLFTFVPVAHAEKVRDAIFEAGAGDIGNYSECSFSAEGIGSFKAKEGTNPFAGEKGKRHYEKEVKLEFVFPVFRQNSVIKALLKSHPYEEVAYDIVELGNIKPGVGSGVWGDLKEPLSVLDFLALLKRQFNLTVVRHTAVTNKQIKRVAVCGGAGSFLLSRALALKMDAFVTGEMKYHQFFDGNGRMLICDIGHFESEQFTSDLLVEVLLQKFPTFAVLKSEITTNPVCYYF